MTKHLVYTRAWAWSCYQQIKSSITCYYPLHLSLLFCDEIEEEISVFTCSSSPNLQLRQSLHPFEGLIRKWQFISTRLYLPDSITHITDTLTYRYTLQEQVPIWLDSSCKPCNDKHDIYRCQVLELKEGLANPPLGGCQSKQLQKNETRSSWYSH